MRAPRLFVAAAAIALVAGPGMAMARNGPPAATPPAQGPPAETPPAQVAAVVVPDDEDEGVGEDEVLGATVADDEGHGQAVSALAECLPSGAELHGTGLTKGFVMRQAASSGEVEIDIPDLGPTTFTLTGELETLCAAVIAMAEGAEAPQTARGRPDWAGPKQDRDRAGAAGERRGPPAHANKGGDPGGR